MKEILNFLVGNSLLLGMIPCAVFLVPINLHYCFLDGNLERKMWGWKIADKITIMQIILVVIQVLFIAIFFLNKYGIWIPNLLK